MNQIIVNELDDRTIARLTAVAGARNMSVEASAREAIRKAADLTVAERRAVVTQLRAWSEEVQVPGAIQTSGLDPIPEDRGG